MQYVDLTSLFLHRNHGTQCAGVIAAEGNNNLCGVGVAYKCKIGGTVIATFVNILLALTLNVIG